ncbi:hypothetical protein HDE_03614 [Halotydeus destructor]|nr:hypothetical protein HDE_03614 [Halotydeus destructor]
MVTVLLLAVLIAGSSADRIGQRYALKDQPNFNLRFGSYQFTRDGQSYDDEPVHDIIFSVLQFKRNQRLYNWSQHLIFMDPKVGEKNATGHFDGMIGSLQRNQVDIVFNLIIQDYFVHDVIVHGPVFMPMELMITQARQLPKFKNSDVAESLGILIFAATLQLSHGLTVAAGVFVTSYLILENTGGKVLESAGRKLSEFIWSCLQTIVGQEYSKYSLGSQRLVWTSVVTSLFFTISGYALNQLSTDSVVAIPFKYADSIDDIIGRHGNRYEIHIDQNLFFNQKVKLAPAATPLGRIYKLIQAQESCPDPRTCNSANILEMTNYIIDSISQHDPRYLALWDKRRTHILLRCIYPYLRNAISEQGVHMSRAPIAEAIAVTAFRKGLPSILNQYLHMRLSFILEFGLDEKLLQIFYSALPKNQLGIEGDHWSCLERPTDDPDVPTIGFRIDRLAKALILVLAGWITSAAMLLTESTRHIILFTSKLCRSRTIKKSKRNLKKRARHVCG